MGTGSQDESPPNKRRKLITDTDVIAASIESKGPTPQPTSFRGIDRPISPPPSRRIRSGTPEVSTPRARQTRVSRKQLSSVAAEINPTTCQQRATEVVASPIQLTRIKGLSDAQNVDTISLGDILGDPMIKECWNFNFLFDIDFVMHHFDSDTRGLVKVKIVHGFWKKEDERRVALLEAAERHPNVQLIGAYMPDPFGTHHSKMLVLIRHDEQAQVIVHTANMISRDWGNMTQAVWRSPLLPLLESSIVDQSSQDEVQAHAIGTGERFKVDLLRYVAAYGKRLADLTSQLRYYDFSAIRAAFIGSTPSRQKVRFAKPSHQTSFGWLGLREVLSTVPVQTLDSQTSPDSQTHPHIIIQISSIATLGPTPAWLTNFQSVLSGHSPSTSTSAASKPSLQSARATFFPSSPKSKSAATSTQAPPALSPTSNIIFPTPHEIQTSLDGYASGASIHMKLQSAVQQKQLQYMRPLLCHWSHYSSPPGIAGAASRPDDSNATVKKAERGPAAPHIKTYIRFSSSSHERIDWAMVTSANLSKQAWGEVENKSGEVWVQSWETGVVVWPALFSSDRGGAEDSERAAVMVPVFGRDRPEPGDLDGRDGGGSGGGNDDGDGNSTGTKQVVVGFRMPYDLPLEPYEKGEDPWCASMAYEEPDWKGQYWKD